MMTFHREGRSIMFGSIALFIVLSAINFYFLKDVVFGLFLFLELGFIVLLYLVLQFFRIPKRTCTGGSLDIMCPADGKVVVIEEVEETEYFKDRRLQVSIFMSPLNVHANYYPIGGEVTYTKYHPGLFLVAWHPKSSTDNERSTCVVKHQNGQEILFRQIAGAMARRICYYAQTGDPAQQGAEFGFIKFGSRVDLFLPLGTKIDVTLNQKVKAKLTKLGSLN
ncbi:MAG: phosphatidylserine decarboxylase family protein [Flavobacteriales bacterium]